MSFIRKGSLQSGSSRCHPERERRLQDYQRIGSMRVPVLLLCACAFLLQGALSDESYLKMKVDNVYVIGTYKNSAMERVQEAVEDEHGEVPSMEGLTIFTREGWDVPNKEIPVVPASFSPPENALALINSLVSSHTSHKIQTAVTSLTKDTIIVITYTVDKLPLPHEGATGRKAPLQGEYNMADDPLLGVTLIEIPQSPYMSVLYAIPHRGREADVEKNLTPKTIAMLRRAMTVQEVNVEVPAVILFAASYMSVDSVPLPDGGESIRIRMGYRQSAAFA